MTEWPHSQRPYLCIRETLRMQAHDLPIFDVGYDAAEFVRMLHL